MPVVTFVGTVGVFQRRDAARCETDVPRAHDCRSEILDAFRVDIAASANAGYTADTCAPLAVAAAKSRSESPRGIYMLIKEIKFPVYGPGLRETPRQHVYGLTADLKIAGNVTKR